MIHKSERVVITTFSPFRAGAVATIGALMILSLIALMFYNPSGGSLDYLRSSGQWMPFMLLALVAAAYFAWLVLMLLRQLLMEDCAAIWIEDGYVIYLSGWRNRTRIDDIAKISADNFKWLFWTTKVIAIVRRDSTTKTIPTSLLSDSAEKILLRLQSIIKQQH